MKKTPGSPVFHAPWEARVYVMNRALRGPQNPTAVDHATDTYDTVDWLVKNVPESKGRVGILGISYNGFLPLMALFDPHPALKAASPQAPITDWFLGDDLHHPHAGPLGADHHPRGAAHPRGAVEQLLTGWPAADQHQRGGHQRDDRRLALELGECFHGALLAGFFE